MSLNLGKVHFVGIGGIGMSGIAEVMHNLGYEITGSDISENANVKRLKNIGIEISTAQKADNIHGKSVVVVSSAIKGDNPEFKAAREQRIPIVKRAEMLAELMRLKTSIAIAGTHGKTTTTSIIASLFEAAGHNPTVINGGIINAYGTNARLGKGEWMIVEADESDGSFIKLPATIGVITNMDPEHLDFYGNFENAKKAYQQFIDNIPFYGFAVLCIDHLQVAKLAPKITDRRVVTYGLGPQADIRATNIRPDSQGQMFDVDFEQGEKIIKDVHLLMHGEHNLLNTLAAIAIANELNFNFDILKKALAGFGGVKRRFTKAGEVNGITIIDDYAHHPVEITATLNSARQAADASGGRVIAVFQPHRYSRIHDLFEDFAKCFNNADVVLISDIYAAGEQPIDGINNRAIVKAIQENGHKNAVIFSGEDDLPALIEEHAGNNDYVVCMGAGSVSLWANNLAEKLQEKAKRA